MRKDFFKVVKILFESKEEGVLIYKPIVNNSVDWVVRLGEFTYNKPFLNVKYYTGRITFAIWQS